MAFPSFAEVQSNIAVKQKAESAPATDPSAATTVQSQTESTGTEPSAGQEEAPISQTQEAEASGTQDAEAATESSEPAPVPYGRFKEKNEQVKTLRETNELLQQQLERLKQDNVVEDKQPEPEAVDPLLEKLDSLDEYGTDSEMVGVMKEMAEELKTLRAKASNSERGVHEIRVQEQVQKIESEIGTVTNELNVHDKSGARVFILQSLAQNPKQDLKGLADQFSQWEKSQEDAILNRLGVKRPNAKQEAKEVEPDVPPRPSIAGSNTGEPAKPHKAPVTLKDLRKTLISGRRR